jgi:NTP pyrophosphatase (non-canonical NTP hydrolase)
MNVLQAEMDLLQAEIVRWRAHNFPDGPVMDTLMRKLMEEVGELAKAISKSDHAQFEDALGDIAVMLFGIAYTGRSSLGACVDHVWEEVSRRDYVKHPGTGRPAPVAP